MRHSTNYNLNLVEGSDTFNPLVNDVSNFETIDAAMRANELAGIGTATELLSGSIHALTRSNDAPVFRFVATANYTAGDTFTVDGQQVTALLPSGETLASGAYVINSSVICALNGTLLTVFTSGGTIALAADSEKLGGRLPEYYGTAAQTSEAVNTAQAAQTIVNALNANLQASYAGATIPFTFGIDEDGNYGYIKAGADSVTPFRSGAGTPAFRTCGGPVRHTLNDPYIATKNGTLKATVYVWNQENAQFTYSFTLLKNGTTEYTRSFAGGTNGRAYGPIEVPIEVAIGDSITFRTSAVNLQAFIMIAE